MVTDAIALKGLLARCRAGDAAAADEVFGLYVKRVEHIARKKIGAHLSRRIEPGDIVQTVFRTVFRRLQQGLCAVEGPHSLSALLARVTERKILRAAERHCTQKRDVRRELSVAHVAADLLLSKAPAAEEVVIVADLVHALLDGLPPTHAEVFYLLLGGETLSAIARLIGRTRWTVRDIREDLRTRLQSLLDGSAAPESG